MAPTLAGSHRRATDVRFSSSHRDLSDGFSWAVARSMQWVQQDAPVASYWAGLTDRPMFYSRDLAHQAVAGHLLGLGVQNRAMLTCFAESATSRRRFYPLWAFLFDGTPAGLDYESDDYFVRETPAPFELVETLLALSRWTGDDSYVVGDVFDSFIRNITYKFVGLHDILGVGVAGEAGTADIFAGSPTYNEGSLAPGLQIAGDGIASQWAAMNAVRNLHPSDSLREFAGREADRLQALFESDWHDSSLRRYVTGFGSDGAIADFAYEPSWFPLVKGLVSDDRRAQSQLDFISREVAAAPPHNIEAFTYLPEAFLRYRRDEEGLHWIRHLINSRADYPEVPFTIVSHLAVGLSGLRLVAADGIATRSHLADGWMEAADLPWADGHLTIRHDGYEASVVRNNRAIPLRWRAEFPTGVVEMVVNPGEESRVAAP